MAKEVTTRPVVVAMCRVVCEVEAHTMAHLMPASEKLSRASEKIRAVLPEGVYLIGLEDGRPTRMDGAELDGLKAQVRALRREDENGEPVDD